MELRASAQRREFFRGESAAAVDGLLVVAGRLDLNQPADDVDHVIALLLQVVQPHLRDLVIGFWSGVSGVLGHRISFGAILPVETRLPAPSTQLPMRRSFRLGRGTV